MVPTDVPHPTGNNMARLEAMIKKQSEGGCAEDTEELLDEEAYIQAMDYVCRVQFEKLSSRQNK